MNLTKEVLELYDTNSTFLIRDTNGWTYRATKLKLIDDNLTFIDKYNHRVTLALKDLTRLTEISENDV